MLTTSGARVSFDKALANIPFEDLGIKPNGIPYSIWQQVEHIRIAQKDILDFSVNKNYKELNWPDDYWPKEAAPGSEAAWKHSIAAVHHDLNEFIKLIEDPAADLFAPIPWGSGQHLFREAILIIDHTSYHTGEIIAIRRLLGAWN